MVVFRTGFNTGRTGPVLAIPEYMIPDRKRKKKKKRKKKEVDLTHITQKFSSSHQFGVSSSWPHTGNSQSGWQ